MVILGLDQALVHTGYCIYETESNSVSHYGILSSVKTENVFERMTHITEQILDLYDRHTPYIVVVEGLPFMSKSSSTRDLAGLQAVIVTELINTGYKLDKNLFIIPPTSVKKYATGSGKADKKEMFEALPSEYKDKIKSIPISKGKYDLTDAYWLAKMGSSL